MADVAEIIARAYEKDAAEWVGDPSPYHSAKAALTALHDAGFVIVPREVAEQSAVQLDEAANVLAGKGLPRLADILRRQAERQRGGGQQ